MAKKNKREVSNSSPGKEAALPRPNKAGKKPHSPKRLAQLSRAARNNRIGTLPSIRRSNIPSNPQESPSTIARRGRSTTVTHAASISGSPVSVPIVRTPSKSASSGKRNPVRNKKIKNPK